MRPHKDEPAGQGVIGGPVMVNLGEPKPSGHQIQLMALHLREHPLGHCYGVDERGFESLDAGDAQGAYLTYHV